MKEIFFVTGNTHKVAEAQAALGPLGYDVKQLKVDYPEDQDLTIEEIAKFGARYVADQEGVPVFVDDTGVYFDAYENFPGPMAKFIATTIGYEGIFRLLEGKDRGMYFKSAIAYCEPGQEPQLFIGEWRGQVTTEVFDRDKDVMPYERIFIADGEDATVSTYGKEKYVDQSHRSVAMRKMANYLSQKQA